jgi:hypothetical protein
MLRRSTLSLLLVLFLSDFALPQAPGAFQFDSEKTVEIADRSVARVGVLGVQLVGAQRPPLSINRVARRVPPAYRVAPVDSASLGYVLPLLAFPAETEPAPSEDH